MRVWREWFGGRGRRGGRAALSVVLGTYNRLPLLRITLDNLREQRIPVPHEIIVVDGGSSDGTLPWLMEQKDVLTIVQHNHGEWRGRPLPRRSWGYFMNLGFHAAQGETVLMISDDCLLLPGAVEKGLAALAAAAADGGRPGGAAFFFRNWPQEERYYVQKTLGGLLMVNHGLFRREALAAVGFAEEEAYRFYKADSDLCLKLWRAGFPIVAAPDSFVEHYMDEAEPLRRRNQVDLRRDRRVYIERWRGIYFHPGQPDPRGKVYSERVPDERVTAVWPRPGAGRGGAMNQPARPEVSIVLGTYNRRDHLRLALATIREEIERCREAFRAEIIVVDGGSDDGTVAWLTRQKDIVTVVQHNRGEWQGRPLERKSWGYFMNLGFRCAQGKYICMLSDDCLVIPGAIGNGCRFFEEALSRGERLGALAFYFSDWPERPRYAVAVNLGRLYVNHGLYLHEALAAAGYLNETDYMFYGADSDIVLTMERLGYTCAACPDSFIEHHVHVNPTVRGSNAAYQRQDAETLLRRWCGVAFPAEELETFRARIGYWQYRDFVDPSRTVERFHTLRPAPPPPGMRRLRVLHVTTHDHGGAAFACLRLHTGLGRCGVDSRVLALHVHTADSGATPFFSRPAAKYLAILRRPWRYLQLRRQWRLHRRRSPEFEMFSAPLAYTDITRHPLFAWADIVHLHWVSRFIDVPTFFRRCGKPVVWTCHDMNPFTGGCHVAGTCTGFQAECRECPQLPAGFAPRYAQKNLRHKRRGLARRRAPLAMTAPSSWMAGNIAAGTLFRDVETVVLPNLLDGELFRPGDRAAARAALLLPQGKRIIAFVCDNVRRHNKGWHLLRRALESLADRDDLFLCMMGWNAAEQRPDFFPTACFAHDGDPRAVRQVYTAADVVVVPSLQESFSQVVAEAFACARPAVAFAVGGPRDLITHGENGYLAAPYDPADLAAGIAWVVADPQRWESLSRRARQTMEERFSLARGSRDYLRLYLEMVGDPRCGGVEDYPYNGGAAGER